MQHRAVPRQRSARTAQPRRSRIRPGAEPSIGDAFELLASELGLRVERPPSAYGSAWALLSAGESHEASVYRYAYALWWDGLKRATLADAVAWVLLNPIATESAVLRRRPTLGYCRNRTKERGHGGLVIVNLFAYRSDRPVELELVPKATAVGPENDRVLQEITQMCAISVAAWGSHGSLQHRSRDVRKLIPDLRCVADDDGPVLTASGEPCHPRRLPTIGTLIPLPGARRPGR